MCLSVRLYIYPSVCADNSKIIVCFLDLWWGKMPAKIINQSYRERVVADCEGWVATWTSLLRLFWHKALPEGSSTQNCLVIFLGRTIYSPPSKFLWWVLDFTAPCPSIHPSIRTPIQFDISKTIGTKKNSNYVCLMNLYTVYWGQIRAENYKFQFKIADLQPFKILITQANTKINWFSDQQSNFHVISF